MLLKSLLLADKRKPTSIYIHKKIRKTKKLESIHEQHFVERKNEGSGQKLESEKTRVYTQKPRLKMLFKNSISGQFKSAINVVSVITYRYLSCWEY
jgi:hypothetical protein